MLALKEEDIRELKIGESILLSGGMYTGRDAAHKRIFESINNINKYFGYKINKRMFTKWWTSFYLCNHTFKSTTFNFIIRYYCYKSCWINF